MSERSRDGRRLADDPIAIVGVSSLFPMARNHREYWQNIVDGTDCISEVPESRWRVSDYYDPDPAAPDKTYSRRGGFIPDVEFSPIEFGLPPNQLDVTSTMQTLSLGVARDLLTDAGATGSAWYDPARTGVVLGTSGPVPLMHPLASRLSTPVLKEVVRAVGLSESDADEIADRYVRAFAPWEEMSFPGLLANVTAGRIANRLDLGGLNSTVDAACAASLSAVRMSIAELIDRRADTMITGGVDMENTIFVYLCFSKVGALSHTDRVSPLSDQADGTLMGEGIGMLALRRLADAERDGNRIYAVIRGLGSSSDGRAKSIYAPRFEGQRIALRRAYEDADCSPASVGLFEAHATGTAVGDKTELAALTELLDENLAERHYAAIGSVKSQIGHTKGAAGSASLIKLALSLYHKTLPPTINVDQPNSQVDYASAPFYVNVATRPWIRDPQRPARRAAVSAMGFGGTNFHVVLQEHDGRRSVVRNLHRGAQAHLWHAADPAALAELLNSGATSADGGPIPAGHARVGLVATGPDGGAELRAMAAARILANPDADAWSLPKGVYYRRSGRPQARVGALFSGQGSQYLNMGLEAALNVPPVGEAFDLAEESFAAGGTRLAAATFPPSAFDPRLRQEQEATLRQTEYAQPAIGALSAGQFQFMRELGLECVSFAGHSFGELTALWAAGSLSTEDYFRLAAARGTAMAAQPGNADTGTMAAITADRSRVAAILAGVGGDVVICNHNAPDQVVVGGGTADVEAVVAACASQGVTARRLPVSAAFHTKYVAHATEAFRAAVGAAKIGPPGAPVHANSPGASYGADPAGNAEILAAQLLRPVEFVAAVEAMRADGVDVFVEFGPKQVLTSLVKRILGDQVTAIATDAGPLGDSDVTLKQAAVQLAVLGVPLAGINRYEAAPLPELKPRGMTITLNGAEYVSPARQAAYAEGINDGFRVTLPGAPAEPTAPAELAAPAAPAMVTVPEHLTNGHSGNGATPPVSLHEQPINARRAEDYRGEAHYREERFPMTAYPEAARPAGDDPAAQHLALHARYLDSQLQVAEALLGLVNTHGIDHPGLPQIAETVKEQSVAIGNAHARAGEVLARLTELELGATPAGFGPAVTAVPGPAAAQAPVPPAPVAAAYAPRGLAGERYAIAAASPTTDEAPGPNGAAAPAAPYAHAGYGPQTPVTVLPDVATLPVPASPDVA
ncbi:MAG TPA: beta-ketoacyl synthase N-terminal-like domain-containing protein, partial [Trebonia sp.]